MKRYYFTNDSLDDLKLIERELAASDIGPEQMHVLSIDDAGVEGHGLNEVHAFLKKDVVRAGEIGALIGLGISVLSIIIAYFSGLPDVIGWVPFLFLSVILLGFFTWEGGFFGFQEPNSRFRRFDQALRDGQHVFLVDVDGAQADALRQLADRHPRLTAAGTGLSAPGWLLSCRQKWRHFLNWAP